MIPTFGMWEALPNTQGFREFMQTPKFLTLPALLPPPGIVPNYENPENLKSPGIVAAQVSITVLVVLIRFHTKICVVKKTLIEDYFIYGSAVVFALSQILVFQIEMLPLGIHQYDLKVGQALTHAKLLFINLGLYAIIITLIRIAATLQIRRMLIPCQRKVALSRQDRLLRWSLDGILAISVMFYISVFFVHWLTCRPIARVWDPRVDGVCAPNYFIIWALSGAVNTASDLGSVIVSQILVWRLKVDNWKKRGLSGVFGLGCLVLLASIFRLRYTIDLCRSDDKTYYGALVARCAGLELTFGIVAASVPVLPAYIRHVRRSDFCSKSIRSKVFDPSFAYKRSNYASSEGGPKSGRFFKIRFRNEEDRRGRSPSISPGFCQGIASSATWYPVDDWNGQEHDRISRQIVLFWDDEGLIAQPKSAAIRTSSNHRR